VLNFFASWCADCRAELSAFGAVSRSTGSKVAFVGVDTNDQNPSLARALLTHAGADYPVARDQDGTVSSGSYAISALPVTFFLDSSGRIVGEAFGAQSRAGLERDVNALERGPVEKR